MLFFQLIGESVDLERVHRLRLPGNRNDGPIIARFTKFKDRDAVLISARQKLGFRSQFRVAEDFTTRVRQARRELGEHLVRARAKGQTASMKFDKLIIDNQIFKYDYQTQKPTCIGYTSYRNNSAARTTASQRSTQQPRATSDIDPDSDIELEGGAEGGNTSAPLL